MALIQTLTILTTMFERRKEKFYGFRQTEVWACISGLHLYCNYRKMIKAQFLIGRHFLGFDILKKIEKRHIRKPPNVKICYK